MARPELRQMIEKGEVFFAPAVWDAITARLARHLGFKVIYAPGSGTGIVVGESEPMIDLTQKAMVAERALEGVADELPMIVDLECGYGNAIHVQLAIRTLEDAGVTAVHIEDQLYPQRAHYFRGVEHIVPIEEYQQRIEYAVKAKRSKDFLIIARNDAAQEKAVEGGTREEAVVRAHAAMEAGADLIFVIGIQADRGDLEYYRKEIKDIPLVTVPIVRDGKPLSLEQYREFGYQIVLYPQVVQPALMAIYDTYKSVKETGYLPEIAQGKADQMKSLTNKLLDFEGKWAVEAVTTEA